VRVSGVPCGGPSSKPWKRAHGEAGGESGVRLTRRALRWSARTVRSRVLSGGRTVLQAGLRNPWGTSLRRPRHRPCSFWGRAIPGFRCIDCVASDPAHRAPAANRPCRVDRAHRTCRAHAARKDGGPLHGRGASRGGIGSVRRGQRSKSGRARCRAATFDAERPSSSGRRRDPCRAAARGHAVPDSRPGDRPVPLNAPLECRAGRAPVSASARVVKGGRPGAARVGQGWIERDPDCSM
jgi:hypothetical protein